MLDLYSILGVSSTSSLDDIKKAYRKAAFACHPDKAKDENKQENETKFKEITNAYSILSDPQKREKYDLTGDASENNFSDDMMNEMPDISELFSNFFGGGFSSFMFGNQFKKRCRPLNVLVDISLEEVHNGAKKSVKFPSHDKCQTCKGTGAKNPNDIINCITCGGKGQTISKAGINMIIQSTCHSCGGKGKTIKNNNICSMCKGNKIVEQPKNIEVTVPCGIPNNEQQFLKGVGGYDPYTDSTCDLILTFRYAIPKNMNIDDFGNVVVVQDIPLENLFCGFKVIYEYYGKHTLVVSKKYFDPSKPLILQEKGLPNANNKKHYGFLKIIWNVIFPSDVKHLQKYNDVFLKLFKKDEEQVTEDEKNKYKIVYV